MYFHSLTKYTFDKELNQYLRSSQCITLVLCVMCNGNGGNLKARKGEDCGSHHHPIIVKKIVDPSPRSSFPSAALRFFTALCINCNPWESWANCPKLSFNRLLPPSDYPMEINLAKNTLMQRRDPENNGSSSSSWY